MQRVPQITGERYGDQDQASDDQRSAPDARAAELARRLDFPAAALAESLRSGPHLRQSQVLFRLAEHPGSHMGDVAKAFGVTLPAVTHIVDRLEEKGLVTRGDYPADRRVYVLDLTRAGKTLVDEIDAIRLRCSERGLVRRA